MDNFKYLVSNLDRGIITDIINRILQDEKILVRECFNDIDDLADCIKDNASYIIFDKKDKKLPSKYKRIFSLNKKLTVIELLDDGRSLAMFIDDIGEEDFIKIINIKQ